MSEIDPQACQAYGALLEGAHVAGYTVERGLDKLEWLLEAGRWRQLGVEFADVNAFVASLKLDNLKVVADQRKRIAERIRAAQPEISNRSIAKAIGVGHQTIGRDFDGPHGPPASPQVAEAATSQPNNGPHGPPTGLSGAEVAKLADRVETKEERQHEKRERREARERALAEATRAAAARLGRKLYGVIYADPPWRFEPYSRESGMDRAADNHYPTMTLDEIRAYPVPAAAAADCALFLWATVPMLPQALEVMAAWGFTYQSNFVWVKNQIGTGYWNRNQHELLLIGTKGDIPAPAHGDQFASVVESDRGRHSAKPFRFREIIEETFPTLPRAEVFARQQFLGWDAIGNEVEEAAQ